MIILQQDAIAEVVTVIVSAADFNSILFKDTHIGSRLAGIQQFCLGAFQEIRDLSGVCRNTAHTLQEVQCGTLAGQQYPNVTTDNAQLFALTDPVTILAGKGNFGAFVEKCKYSLKHIQAGNDTVFLTDQLHLTQLVMGHNGIGGDIFAGDVFLQSTQN